MKFQVSIEITGYQYLFQRFTLLKVNDDAFTGIKNLQLFNMKKGRQLTCRPFNITIT